MAVNGALLLQQFLVLSSIAGPALSRYYEKDLTFTVDAGTSICLYETVHKDQVVEIEYQVVDGGHGDLDINMRAVEPGGRVLIADYKRSDNSHRFSAQLDGDHMFCFDNTISHFNTKTIYFDLIIDAEREEEDSDYPDLEKEVQLNEGSEEYAIRVADIMKIVNRVQDLLSRAQHVQKLLSTVKTQDRNTAEENYSLVQKWSMLQIVVMISVGLVQVIMLRSLFDDNSRVHGIWKSLPSQLR